MPLPLIIGGIVALGATTWGIISSFQATQQAKEKTEQAKINLSQTQLDTTKSKVTDTLSDSAKVASTPSQFDDILLYGKPYIMPVIVVIAIIALIVVMKK